MTPMSRKKAAYLEMKNKNQNFLYLPIQQGASPQITVMPPAMMNRMWPIHSHSSPTLRTSSMSIHLPHLRLNVARYNTKVAKGRNRGRPGSRHKCNTVSCKDKGKYRTFYPRGDELEKAHNLRKDEAKYGTETIELFCPTCKIYKVTAIADKYNEKGRKGSRLRCKTSACDGFGKTRTFYPKREVI